MFWRTSAAAAAECGRWGATWRVWGGEDLVTHYSHLLDQDLSTSLMKSCVHTWVWLNCMMSMMRDIFHKWLWTDTMYIRKEVLNICWIYSETLLQGQESQYIVFAGFKSTAKMSHRLSRFQNISSTKCIFYFLNKRITLSCSRSSLWTWRLRRDWIGLGGHYE